MVGPNDTSNCLPGVCDFFFLYNNYYYCELWLPVPESLTVFDVQELILTPGYPKVKATLVTDNFNLYLASLL